MRTELEREKKNPICLFACCIGERGTRSIGVMLNVRERLSWDRAISLVLGHGMTDVAGGILPRCCKKQIGPG